MNAAIFHDKPDKQLLALTDAQTKIKVICKEILFKRKNLSSGKAEILLIIKEAASAINNIELKAEAQKSLRRFAAQALKKIKPASASWDKDYINALLILNAQNSTNSDKIRAEMTLKSKLDRFTEIKGLPLEEYAKNYIDKRVKPVLRKLLELQATKTEDSRSYGTLKNLAEMTIRSEAQKQEIAELRSNGEKLVVCSVHADCSERCRPWQGRVYSLDGTTGTTKDGRRFVPLETATEVYYTTKAGKKYRNGLLGYNCRHRLIPYKEGMIIPKVSAKEQRCEYEITKQQRSYENRIYNLRDKSLIYKGVDDRLAVNLKRQAATLNKKYIQFSRKNGRAYYPDRVKLLMK